MTTRAEFMARVRSTLGRQPNASCAPPPASDDRLLRLCNPSEPLPRRFAQRAAAAGMHVHTCDSSGVAAALSAALGAALGAALEGVPAGPIVVDGLDPELARGVREELAVRGVRALDPMVTRGLDAQFDASAAVTGVWAAIAETGTLVLVSDARRSRGSFIVPPVHVAVVRISQIVPDMIDVWRRFGASPPTAITLISGPSKTADIEGILVTGVHGPRAVHVILVAEGLTPPT